MPDHSHLDSRYFVNEKAYNCPFCNRRNVAYSVVDTFSFDWTTDKPCEGFLVLCRSCGKHSMHLTFTNLNVQQITYDHQIEMRPFEFIIPEDADAGEYLDTSFFYSVPTSFFVLDERVPRILRELLVEAEGCLKSNFLTGASACARKIVYELGVIEGAQGENYEDRIKSLKDLHPEVEPEFFDTLLTIQQVTSAKVHEQSYDGWESKHLRVILSSLSEVLHELYVLPALRADRRKKILKLKENLVPKPATLSKA